MRHLQALHGRHSRPFLGGQIINFISSKSKKAKQKILLLEAKIKTMEDVYFRSSCTKIQQDLLLLRAQYNEITASKAAANLLKLKQCFFWPRGKTGENSSLAYKTTPD